MKNKILAGLITLLVISAPALAETTVDTTWDTNGYTDMSIDFYSGDDMESHFKTQALATKGEYHAKDYDNDPYSYGVDTNKAWLDASISNGGWMDFETKRTDSKISMYGNAGQRTYSKVYSYDGTAEMAFYTQTNYAEMGNCQYGKGTTTNGVNFEASGTGTEEFLGYKIYHELTDADEDGAYISAYGHGSAEVKLQGEKAGGKNSYYNMGSLKVCGDGCAWKDNYATFDGSGTGVFKQYAWADNEIDVGCPDCATGYNIPGDGSDNSAKYYLEINYAGDFSYDDFGVRGN